LEAVRAGKEEASVEAAMNEAVLGRPPEELRGLQSEVAGALAAVRAIQRALAVRIEEGCGPDLSPLEQTLGAVREFLEEKEVSSRLVRNDQSEESDPRPGESGKAYGGRPAEGSPAMDRPLEDRNEVDRVLRRVEEYYRQREPGSPNLLLIQRLRRYLEMDFLALIEDLHPESVEPLRNVTKGRVADEEYG
jgi:type VI secretion system protein ImpA